MTQEWEWKLEILNGFGDDPDILDVLHFASFAEANAAAAENAPARVGLARLGEPETVYYVRHGALDAQAPARFRREVRPLPGGRKGRPKGDPRAPRA